MNNIKIKLQILTFFFSSLIFFSFFAVSHVSAESVFTIYKTGSGTGLVYSQDGSLQCTEGCTSESASFSQNTTVTLIATPDYGSNFGGWSGACTGTSTSCVLIANGDKDVTATFTSTVPPSTKFHQGDYIKTTTIVNVRANPGINEVLLGAQPKGMTGTIFDSNSVYKDGYHWWQVTYDDGQGYEFGWSAEGDGTTDWLVLRTVPNSTVDISANPTSVVSGGSSTITWSSSGTTYCTGLGGTNGWSGTKGTSGTFNANNITSTTTFEISCSGTSSAVSDQVTININNNNGGGGGGGSGSDIIPLSMSWTPDPVSQGGGATVSFEVKNQGSSSTGAFNIKLTQNGTTFCTWLVPGLTTGGIFSHSGCSGNYGIKNAQNGDNIIFTVDYLGEVSESNESNNIMAKTVAVSGSTGGGGGGSGGGSGGNGGSGGGSGGGGSGGGSGGGNGGGGNNGGGGATDEWSVENFLEKISDTVSASLGWSIEDYLAKSTGTNKCTNSAVNYPQCTVDSVGRCLNGKSNPPLCTTGTTLPPKCDLPPPPPSQNALIEDGGFLVIEAENFDDMIPRSDHSWVEEKTVPGYSGNSYMIAIPDDGMNNDTDYDALSPDMQYKIKITSGGIYYIWIHGSAIGDFDNSVHLGIDGRGQTNSDRISLQVGSSFGWTANTTDGTYATISIPRVGYHTLNLWMREDGAQVDKIILTKNPKYIPSEMGPQESLRETSTPPAGLPPECKLPPPDSCSAGKFLIGDRVITSANLNVRSTSSTSGYLVGIAPNKTQGEVIGDSTLNPADGYIWLQVKYDNGMTGWSVQSYLTNLTPHPCDLPPASTFECNDGKDNDNDGDTDYPSDKGCRSVSDNDERDPPPIVDFNLPYPRLSHTTWGGAVTDWLARFDLIDNFVSSDSGYAKAIKEKNINTRIVVTRDFNQGLSQNINIDAWKVRNSSGQVCPVYFAGDEYYNYTDQAPEISTEYGTMRYNEYISHWMTDPKNIPLAKTTPSIDAFDGVMTDGLWEGWVDTGGPCTIKNVDLDGNGVSDFSEHGEGWINSQIYNGAGKIQKLLREKLDDINPNLLLIINPRPQAGEKYANGYEYEHWIGTYGFEDGLNDYLSWLSTSAKPSTPIFATGQYEFGYKKNPSRNDVQFMRYGLTFVLMGEGFYDFQDKPANEHYWNKRFDDMEFQLGYPTGDGKAKKLPSGAWARFFDNGVAVVNGTDNIVDVADERTVQVTASDLRGADPDKTHSYFRFLGGQDLAINGANAINNGEEVTDSNPVELTIHTPWTTEDWGYRGGVADGVILVYEPTAVVTDIVIDNWGSGTSPGSLAPGDYYEASKNQMIGFKQEADPTGSSCDAGSDFYTVRCSINFWWEDDGSLRIDSQGNPVPDDVYMSPPYAVANANQAGAQMIYKPGIGVAGKYEVYEWHGKINNTTMASNVPYIITSADGQDTKTVNQRENAGQWNSLGVYQFDAGTSGNVTITADGTNGKVMADAVKFVYRGGE